MGICESINNSPLNNNQISFRCFYDVKNTYDEISIINDKDIDIEIKVINKEIKSKIKILNNNKKEEIIFKKKFNKIGIHTVDFIIERKLTNMNKMFEYCKSLIKIELFSFDTSKVTDMSHMFSGCESLEYLDLSNFDTSSVEKMNNMFSFCFKLKEIKGINNFNTSKVTDMWGMFMLCYNLKFLDLSNFNILNVKNLSAMFDGCFRLKEIKGINNFNTSKVIDMSSMFKGCEIFESLDLSNFDTSNVVNMESMFRDCKNLKEIKGITNIKTSKVTDMSQMFKDCISLEYLDLSNFDTSNAENYDEMFYGCYKLKEIKGITNFKIKNWHTIYMFDKCDELDYLIISNNKIIIDTHKLISQRKAHENEISVMFFIPDQNIHYPIPCNESDGFSKIERKLFDEFPELKYKNIYYIANGNSVNQSLTLKQNKIKNGSTILINYIDLSN